MLAHGLCQQLAVDLGHFSAYIVRMMMTEIRVGQVYEDADVRRPGRTFKVSNLDGDTVTCENLTGANGIKPNRSVSFISLSRLKSKKYKLKTDIQKEIITANVVSDVEIPIVNNLIQMPSVMRRNPDDQINSMISICNTHWPINGRWRKFGSFILADNDMFEITIRPEMMTDLFEVKIKMYRYCIFDGRIRGKIEYALDSARTQLYSIVNNVNSLLKKEE